MAGRDALMDQMASVKPDVRRRMDAAIAAILALAWEYRSAGFSFEARGDLDREVNGILAGMSDGILADAKARVRTLLEDMELEEYEEEALENALGEVDGQDARYRMDMRASHLKELLAAWLACAAVSGLSMRQTMASLYSYLSDPSASKDWRNAGLGRLGWGSGYTRNVLDGMALIGQNIINAACQYARIRGFAAAGAIGYRTVRRSSYDCPYCDDMSEMVWPLDETVLPYHPRCVCEAVPVFAENNTDHDEI